MEAELKSSLKEVPFANHTAWKIENETVRKMLMTKLLSAWRVKGRTKHFFPGPMAVSVTKINLHNIVSQKYMVCEKSDGERYLLFLTTVDSLNVAVFINRSMEMFLSSFFFDNSVYQNTIIDGELISLLPAGGAPTSEGGAPPVRGWVFMSFDIVCVCGVNLKKNKLSERLTELHNLLSHKYFISKSDVCGLFMKRFYDLSATAAPAQQLESAMNSMKSTYNSDGLIFTPVDLGVMENTHYSLLKWKSSDTIDFQITERDGNKYMCILNGSTPEEVQMVTETEIPLEVGSIVECRPTVRNADKKGKATAKAAPVVQWTPILVREDKDAPNTIMTLERTLQTIRDQIDIEYIKNLLMTK